MNHTSSLIYNWFRWWDFGFWVIFRWYFFSLRVNAGMVKILGHVGMGIHFSGGKYLNFGEPEVDCYRLNCVP